ncbi:D-sedoheptulose-7-phosphate isomerase [Alicyclobacillus mengziensis]|uniref:SIS domain-containing protein n=1 Tax=Alicyclobacillus mengziensis TaxID=2931921 RepID=A0A9X7VYR8_9BACL|nr:SIS domain-containing protein [Alicyclobacillus mengziensis]QSO47529.1 SIS domain-containing protein [Alicyclobacillus mengziensis]
MKQYQSAIEEYLKRETEILSKLDVNAINDAMNAIELAYERRARIYIFGNGGSASTASHFTNDFNKGVSQVSKRKFEFVCLNDNIATLMAIANDLSYSQVFDEQLRGRLNLGDLVIGISGSGNSANVVRAIEYSKEFGVTTIGITGYDGGKVAALCDISLHVPIHDMQITEDVHLIFNHLMMSIFYNTLGEKR